ncbi:MAG TPA: hypothetical protein VEA81_10205 [Burkholderiaceae bacterium]|nr:hypothetical protein [Burkholderiaceae bacterium]
MPTVVPPLRAALLAVLCAAPALAAAAVDLGDPSVMSQQGQRLKLALPYGSTPGERVSVSRFEVVSVQAPAGGRAPEPADFTIAKPERRNLVLLQSREPVDAPELLLAVRVADQPGSEQTWRIAVPAPRAAAPVLAAASPVRATAAERPARRVPTRPAQSVR